MMPQSQGRIRKGDITSGENGKWKIQKMQANENTLLQLVKEKQKKFDVYQRRMALTRNDRSKGV